MDKNIKLRMANILSKLSLNVGELLALYNDVELKENKNIDDIINISEVIPKDLTEWNNDLNDLIRDLKNDK